jgi:hemerythrin superfamily protein
MPDVVELIMQDHREVERLFEELRTQPDKRALSVPVLVGLLTAHSRAEEAEVYPVARDEAGAAELVAHSQQEHAEADELLKQLEAADPASADFEQLLEKVVEAVTHHVEEEESNVLPAMREGLDASRLDELAQAFVSSREEHLGERPGDITKKERQQQAANAGISGSSTMSKDEIAEAVAKGESAEG